MNIKINQPAGFGDIFFTQKIGKRLIEMGHTVYWPIVKEYSAYVNDYMVGDIKWHEPNHYDILLDLGRASWLVEWQDKNDIYAKVMEAKYIYTNTLFPEVGDWSDWNKYLEIKRNHEKEEELCKLLIKDKEYAIVNRHFATDYLELETPIKSDLPEIEIVKIQGFTLFDWCGVLERATEIRIPDSSFPYLVEILNTTDKLFMYKRNNEPCVRTKPIWKKGWVFVE